MTTKIQKRFFEKYNIPKRFYTIVNLGDLDYNYQEVSADTLEELFDNVQMYLEEWVEDVKYFKDYEEKYPEITDSIYYKLEEIIAIDPNYNLLFDYNNGIYYYSSTWTASDNSDYHWNDTCAKNREDALLLLFIKLSDCFQSQVQDLFKH